MCCINTYLLMQDGSNWCTGNEWRTKRRTQKRRTKRRQQITKILLGAPNKIFLKLNDLYIGDYNFTGKDTVGDQVSIFRNESEPGLDHLVPEAIYAERIVQHAS
jgi:hypothetical protein